MTIKRKQRIRLRLHGCPVKLDGTVTAMSPDGSSVTVVFDDGTLGTVTLYPYGLNSSASMSDRPNCRSAVGENARLFEVL